LATSARCILEGAHFSRADRHDSSRQPARERHGRLPAAGNAAVVRHHGRAERGDAAGATACAVTTDMCLVMSVCGSPMSTRRRAGERRRDAPFAAEWWLRPTQPTAASRVLLTGTHTVISGWRRAGSGACRESDGDWHVPWMCPRPPAAPTAPEQGRSSRGVKTRAGDGAHERATGIEPAFSAWEPSHDPTAAKP
jgi:hypothetical protein